jgi:3-methyladenine DNA glycosylase AlkD
MSPAQFVAQVQRTLEAQRDPERAAAMAAYMKDQFPFLGISHAEQRPLLGPLLRPLPKTATEAWALEVAQRLWALPEREYQYAVAALLSRVQACLNPASLPMLEGLLTQKSWWDSVDALAPKAVGALVLRYPALRREMDRWSQAKNFWLRRAAILHQLSYKAQTDPERLFGHALENAADKEFFVRKAIGWALREYAKTNPAAVRSFVAGHRDTLSPLSVREALKHNPSAKSL